jgi:hypothetical protein
MNLNNSNEKFNPLKLYITIKSNPISSAAGGDWTIDDLRESKERVLIWDGNTHM